MKVIGKVHQKIKDLLGINVAVDRIILSEGLIKHLKKRHHLNMLPYMDKISEILKEPDYVGINPNEPDTSLEYVKVYADNVLVAVKLDIKEGQFFIATMHELSEKKIARRLHSGRLKQLTKK